MWEHIGYMAKVNTNNTIVGTTDPTSYQTITTTNNTSPLVSPTYSYAFHNSLAEEETSLQDLLYKVLQAQGVLLKELEEIKEEIASMKK